LIGRYWLQAVIRGRQRAGRGGGDRLVGACYHLKGLGWICGRPLSCKLLIIPFRGEEMEMIHRPTEAFLTVIQIRFGAEDMAEPQPCNI